MITFRGDPYRWPLAHLNSLSVNRERLGYLKAQRRSLEMFKAGLVLPMRRCWDDTSEAGKCSCCHRKGNGPKCCACISCKTGEAGREMQILQKDRKLLLGC